jgi:hypothetical protein
MRKTPVNPSFKQIKNLKVKGKISTVNYDSNRDKKLKRFLAFNLNTSKRKSNQIMIEGLNTDTFDLWNISQSPANLQIQRLNNTSESPIHRIPNTSNLSNFKNDL